MGAAGSLPLPVTPVPVTPVPASPAPAATTAQAGGPASVSVSASDGAAPAPTLFDLLLGMSADATAALPGSTPAAPSASGDSAPAAPEPSVDPLQLVLAQMPQLQPPAAVAAPVATAAAAGIAMTTATTTLPAATLAPAPAGLAAAPAAATGEPEASFANALRTAPYTATPQPELLLPLATGSDAALSPALATAEPGMPPIAALQATGGHVPAALAPATTAAPVAPPILQQPADPAGGYDNAFSSHIAWLAGQGIGQAEIRVTPEHLGAIDIHLQLDGSEVRADFHSTQPEVRQALEASLPRLREMLGQQGLQLAHAGVGQGRAQGDGQRQQDGSPQQGNSQSQLAADGGDALPTDIRRARGLLDVYA